MNRVYNGIRHKMGKDYWLLSSCIKTRFNNANRHIVAFENLVADYARKQASTASFAVTFTSRASNSRATY